MSVTATAIYTEARALLNDTSAAIYTDAVMLPFINKAYDELQSIFNDNDIPVNAEDTLVLTVPANTVTLSLTSTPALPADFMFPITLWERQQADNLQSDFMLMFARRTLPKRDPDTYLIDWVWQGEVIKLIGATAITEVQIYYKKKLTAIASGATEVLITDAKTFLAERLAGMCSFYIGENETRAATLQQAAELSADRLISRIVKMRQDTPVRRLPNRTQLVTRGYIYGRRW
jgi:hypothetical protein